MARDAPRPPRPGKLARAAMRALALGVLQVVAGLVAFAFLMLHALTPV